MLKSVMMGFPERRQVYTYTPGVQSVMAALERLMARPTTENHANALPVLGPPGWGKTEVVVQFCYEETKRREAEGRCFRCAFVRLPGTASTKNIASRTLDTLGDPAPNSGDAASMTHRVVNLLTKGAYDLLIFDDVDNLIDQETDRVVQKAAAWLQEMLNSTKTPIVMTGTRKFTRVLRANAFLRRRCGSLAPLDPLDWTKDRDLSVFRLVANDIERIAEAKIAPALSKKSMSMRLCYASFGLIGLALRLVREAVDETMRRGSQTVTIEVFRDLVAERIKMGEELPLNPFDLPDAGLEDALRANPLPAIEVAV